METETQKIVNKNKLSISRIADWAKEAFVDRAEKEFCDDYGQCLMAMVKEYEEYSLIKQLYFSGELKQSNEQPIENKNKLRFGNGKRVKTGGLDK